MIVVLPKILSVDDYGAWQLYIFFMSYIGFLHFGWEDGIYLRYAGQNYNEINKKVISSQIYGIVVLEIIISSIIVGLLQFIEIDYIRKFIYYAVCLSLIIANFNNVVNIIFQVTNRISDYATRVALEKFSFPIIIAVFYLIGLNYELILLAQIISLMIVAIFSIKSIKDVLCYGMNFDRIFIQEMSENIRVGIRLLLANIAGMLIVGILRYGIAANWSLAIFGQISLCLSVLNFYMLAINSASVVLFPTLKKLNYDNIYDIFNYGREAMLMISMLLLLFYYPIVEFLRFWLPKYEIACHYLVYFFPLCLFETKINLLFNTYLKVLRLETNLLKCNIYALIISTMLTIYGYITKNINILIITFLLVDIFRCIYSEYCISSYLKIKYKAFNNIEVILTIAFISSNLYLPMVMSFAISMFFILIIVMIKKEKIKNVIMMVKKF